MKILYQLFLSGWAAPLWFLMLFSNIFLPWATLWSKRLRVSIPVLVIVSIFIQIGMYLERYIIIPVSLGYNELPFDWGVYIPHVPESVITIGAFSLVAFLYLIFSRIFPLIPVWEVEEGQIMRGLRRIGRALIPTRSEGD